MPKVDVNKLPGQTDPSEADAAEVRSLLPSMTESHEKGNYRERMEDASSMQLINMQNVSHPEIPRLMQRVVDQLQRGLTAMNIDQNDGTTFLAAIIKDNRLHIAFLGDSECGVLKQSEKGNFTFDRLIKKNKMHTPVDSNERSNAIKAGAKILRSKLILQSSVELGVTRSIHCDQFERKCYSENPEFMHKVECLPPIDLNRFNANDHLILSCDGLTEPDTGLNPTENTTALLNAAVNDNARNSEISAGLLVESAFSKGSRDNISVICVKISDLHAACNANPDLAIIFNINDGHGGPEAANYCASQLKKVMVDRVQRLQADKKATDESQQVSNSSDSAEPTEDTPSQFFPK